MERNDQTATALRSLLWEGEPVLCFVPPRVELPKGAPRRVTAYYRRLEEMWRQRWEGVVYRRACAAAAEARGRSRPFTPWTAGLTARTEEEGELLRVQWEAAEQGQGRRCVLAREDLWQLPGGTPAPVPGRPRKKSGGGG